MTYQQRGRQANAFICVYQVIYHNFTAQEIPYPDYRPIYGMALPDGTIPLFGYFPSAFFSRDDGWNFGIQGNPPSIAPSQTNFAWTWYGVTQEPGSFCRFLYLRWQKKWFAAEYDAQGNLIGNPPDNFNAP